MQKSSRVITQKSSQESKKYPPVVSVLGHVDHGKTTLLDAFRKTSQAAKEHGGITQRIGASEVEVLHETKSRRIVFIDTPGHEAFSNMRSQGVSASDIVLLVVSATDSVMPQTIESIAKIKEARVPFIVVITKIDLESANLEKTLGELSKQGVALEGRGGDVPYIAVSAKTGKQIDDLLGLILLVYDLTELKKDEREQFYGVVIDCSANKKMGTVATVVVKQGKVKKGDTFYAGTGELVGKCRALINPYGKMVDEAFPGDAVEILGIGKIIAAGTVLYVTPPEKDKNKIVPEVSKKAPIGDALSFLEETQEGVLRIILKTETAAELEAILAALPERVEVVSSGQGEISVSDVMIAKDLKAVLIGFNVGISKEAKRLCESEEVLFRMYRIIYELIDEVHDTLEAFVKQQKEVSLGRGSIIASFVTKDGGKIAGTRVLEGTISLNDEIKILRGNKELTRSKITSLKRGKNDIKSAVKGSECGILLVTSVDFRPGDVLLSYRI